MYTKVVITIFVVETTNQSGNVFKRDLDAEFGEILSETFIANKIIASETIPSVAIATEIVVIKSDQLPSVNLDKAKEANEYALSETRTRRLRQ